MKINELREKKTAELDRLLVELREQLHGLRFKDAGKQLKGVRDIRVVRKDIARVLTVKKEQAAKAE